MDPATIHGSQKRAVTVAGDPSCCSMSIRGQNSRVRGCAVPTDRRWRELKVLKASETTRMALVTDN